ncbi:hypothetical protein [Spongiibacter sp.]|uniref:hypothetical protein n=1 Tax=Spongiibacter sp. TaxID=2024860 RepID=UPI003569598F
MYRYYKAAPPSDFQQRQLRRELSRQVEEFLNKGGRIQQLDGPTFKPHRSVRVSSSVFIEML